MVKAYRNRKRCKRRMKKNILMRTNLLICVILLVGFSITAVLSYQANYSASLESIEQVSDLSSEGIYYQMNATFTKPVNISLTMASDSLLRDFLDGEQGHLEDAAYIETLREYLDIYRGKYQYDSVFLVSAATGRYYNFNGLNRMLTRDNPENVWYYELMDSSADYQMNVDNDEANGDVITVFVNCKIYNTQGQVAGVVGVGLRIDGLQELLRGYQSEFGVNTCFINEQGIIQISCAHTGYDKVNLFERDIFTPEAKRQILEVKTTGKANSLWTPDFGKKSYMVARYLPELDWYLIVERDTGALVERMNIQMAGTVSVVAIIIIATLLIISYVIRGFNRRILLLARSTEQERHTLFEKATEQLFENIYELDITHNCPANRATEEYFEGLGVAVGTPYNQALCVVAEKQIKEEFRQGYIDTFKPENVLSAYENGQETLWYDFMISTGGEYYWMHITARIVKLESGAIHMLMYRQNIDAEKQREHKMQTLAQTDEMTGLLTKTATQRRIEKILSENNKTKYAFFIFDIDNFKQANDRFGHVFGDGVIQEFVAVLREYFKEEDIVGRVGGDEFAAFLSITEEIKIKNLCRVLSAALNRLYTEDGKSWRISASIGVALAPKDGTDFASLYRHADAALYETKRRGKNGYTLYHTLLEKKK